VPEGSLILMEKLNDVLLDCIVAFLKEREQACQIDFTDCEPSNTSVSEKKN
jgi:hypothetical protein